MMLKILVGIVLFLTVGFAWFVHRMGDKHGTDKRVWVKALDFVLILPLLPIALIFGSVNKLRRGR